MSKTPIRASSPAAVVCGMPWSWAAGMKCVPIRPFVDQPQIQNVPTRIQKTRDRRLSRSVSTASRAADGPPADRVCRAGRLASSRGARPRRRTARQPTSAGRSAHHEQDERHEEHGRDRHHQRGIPPARPHRERRDARGGRRAVRPRRPPRRCRSPGRGGLRRTSGWPRSRRGRAPWPRCRCRRPDPTAATAARPAVISVVRPLPTATSSSERGDHAPDAEALHQGSGERSGEAVDHEVGGHRAGGRRAAPAELGLQRLEQRAGRGAEAGGGDERPERPRRPPTRRGGSRGGAGAAVAGRHHAKVAAAPAAVTAISSR